MSFILLSLKGHIINNLLTSSVQSLNIVCGVPQDSVLGPLLFLLYVNDIYSSSLKFKLYFFAYDTNILFAHRNLKSLEKIMNDGLSKVCKWLISNKFSLNIKKSNFIIFRPYQKKIA